MPDFQMKTTLKAAGASVRRRGFLDGDDVMAQRTILLAEELGEFCEAVRHGDGAAMLMELADLVIGCAGIAEYKGWNLDAAVRAKCARDEMERGRLHEGGGGLAGVPKGTNGRRLPDLLDIDSCSQ